MPTRPSQQILLHKIACRATNGRIRPLSADLAMPKRLPGNGWLPRHTDLDKLSDGDIRNAAMSVNLTPRKHLGFRSPAEAFLNELEPPLTIRFNTRVARRD